MLNLKHPEHLDYNLDILFISILMYFIWLSGAADEECFHFMTRESLTLLSWTSFRVREFVGRLIELFFFLRKKKLYFNEKSGILLAPIRSTLTRNLGLFDKCYDCGFCKSLVVWGRDLSGYERFVFTSIV